MHGRANKGRQFTDEHRANIGAAKRGSRSPVWKGDAAGYMAKHHWMRRHFEKQGVCEECGRVGKTDWANLSGEYRRDREDYAEMCRSCHFRRDYALKAKS